MGPPVGPYGPWVNLEPGASRAAHARLRVVAIPQAGMGAWAYHGWQRRLGPAVEVLPVELPGRNSRMGEPKPLSMPESVEALVEGLCPVLREGRLPFVLLGHSLGAWMAYEAAVRFADRGLPPAAVIVSGARAPHLAAPEFDADRETPALAGISSSADFWTAFERRYGRNPDLASAGIKSFVEPLLRADFNLLETYRPAPGPRRKLPCPLIACCALGDDRVHPESQLTEWAEYSDTFEAHWFEIAEGTPAWSTPHRYLLDAPEGFLAFLREKCADLVAAAYDTVPSPG